MQIVLRQMKFVREFVSHYCSELLRDMPHAICIYTVNTGKRLVKSTLKVSRNKYRPCFFLLFLQTSIFFVYIGGRTN